MRRGEVDVAGAMVNCGEAEHGSCKCSISALAGVKPALWVLA